MKPNIVRWISRGLASLLIAVSAVGMAQAAPVRSMKEIREQRVVVQQWDLSCGAAVLGTILRHEFGLPLSEREVAIRLMAQKEYVENPWLVRYREGFSLLDMQRFVEEIGLKGEGFGQMSFEDLERRAPVIVPVSRHGYNHFVVLRGTARNRVLIADPSFGTRTMTRAQFERVWSEMPGMGRVGFTVSYRDDTSTRGALDPRVGEFYTFS